MGMVLWPRVTCGVALQLVDDEVMLVLHLTEDAMPLRWWADTLSAPMIDPGKDELECLALRVKH